MFPCRGRSNSFPSPSDLSHLRLKEASREGSKVRNCGILMFRGWLWNDLEDLQYWNVFLGLVLLSATGDHMVRSLLLRALGS